MNTTAAYPIGEFQIPESVTDQDRETAIATIARLPEELGALMDQMTPQDLDKTYREGGWSVRQVIHHLADSHMNALIRFKLAVTEDNPHVLGYDQAAWATHADVQQVDVKASLALLTGLHARWAALLTSFGSREWQCTYYHLEYKRQWTMNEVVMLYAWHCQHHVQHIKNALA